MKKRLLATFSLVVAAAVFSGSFAPAGAAPSDIVPQGSSLLDAFVVLSKTNTLVGRDYTTSDFLGSRLYSRGELAEILEKEVLSDKAALASAQGSPRTSPALRAALIELEPELKLDGYDADGIAKTTPTAAAAYDLMLQVEGRDNTDAGKNKGGQLQSGLDGIYRGTAQGDISSSARYAVSLSNWYDDGRRISDNDLGANDFNALQQAYVEFHNNHGLRLDIGRLYDNWGPGYSGATLLSDNSPPFDQIDLSFPFSLGCHIGRNYTFDQMITLYSEFGAERYEENRRVGYQFNKQWQADFQEGFKSASSSTLTYTPIPFDFGQGINQNTLLTDFNYQLNLGLTYSPAATSRIYGQFFLDDMKSPVTNGTRFLGFDLGNKDFVARKISYLVGGHTELKHGPALTLEYSFSDPNTYSYRNLDAIWQHGDHDWMGLPGGPDTKQIYARIDQRIGKPVTLSLEYRDRLRPTTSWIAPTAQELTAAGSYQLNNLDSVGLSYIYYAQNPYPYTPAVDVNPYAPVSEGYVGQHLRADEVDVSYKHVF